MRPLTYLCFTLLSIAIQFCLMDLTSEQLQPDVTSSRKRPLSNDSEELSSYVANEVFKTIKRKPHALYYRTDEYTTASATPPGALLDATRAVDASTTDTYLEGLDNVTELTYFDEASSTAVPTTLPKNIEPNKCYCNLLYNMCDINCCCDAECAAPRCDSDERARSDSRGARSDSRGLARCGERGARGVFDSIFCIDKVNLPEHTKLNKNSRVDNYNFTSLKWHDIGSTKVKYPKFDKTNYTIGSPVRILKDSTLRFIEIPFAATNGYCDGTTTLKFMVNERVTCFARLADLHMFRALRDAQRPLLAAADTDTDNSTAVDCTSVRCVSWSVSACARGRCEPYGAAHEPACDALRCRNVARRVRVELRTDGRALSAAALTLTLGDAPAARRYVRQELVVDFVLGDEPLDAVVRLSGSPGYLPGRPVVASIAERDRTERFYERTGDAEQALVLPRNVDGRCVRDASTRNVVKFNRNERFNCRIALARRAAGLDGAAECRRVQDEIVEMLGLGGDAVVSPLGDPRSLADAQWLPAERAARAELRGEHRANGSELACSALVTGVHYVLVVAREVAAEEQFRVVRWRAELAAGAARVLADDWSLVLRVSTRFVRARSASTRRGAAHPLALLLCAVLCVK